MVRSKAWETAILRLFSALFYVEQFALNHHGLYDGAKGTIALPSLSTEKITPRKNFRLSLSPEIMCRRGGWRSPSAPSRLPLRTLRASQKQALTKEGSHQGLPSFDFQGYHSPVPSRLSGLRPREPERFRCYCSTRSSRRCVGVQRQTCCNRPWRGVRRREPGRVHSGAGG